MNRDQIQSLPVQICTKYYKKTVHWQQNERLDLDKALDTLYDMNDELVEAMEAMIGLINERNN